MKLENLHPCALPPGVRLNQPVLKQAGAFQSLGHPLKASASDGFVRFAGEKPVENKPVPDEWRVGVTLGNNALKLAKPGDALTYFLKTLRDYGKDNDLVKGVVGNGLGEAYTLLGSHEEAGLFLRDAFNRNLLRVETDPTDVIQSMTNLGRLALLQSKSEKALAWLEEGLQYAKDSKNKPGVIPCSPQVEYKLQEEVGYAYYEADQMDNAAEHLERAVEIGIKKLRNPHDKGVNRQMANLQYFLTELYLEQEKPHSAEATAEEALIHAQRSYHPDSTHLIRFLELHRDTLELGDQADKADDLNAEIERIRESARIRKERRENRE